MPDSRSDRAGGRGRAPARGPRHDGRSRGARPRTATREAGAPRTQPQVRSVAQARRPAAATAGRPDRSSAPDQSSSRLTGRAGVLILVVALLVVSYASSMRAYLQQRHQIRGLQSQIAQREHSIDALSEQKLRWHDPAYAEERARQIGYTMPGETPYVVLQGGKPIAPGGTLDSPAVLAHTTPPAWWSSSWDSMEVAGHPPTKAAPVPLTTVPAPTK